MRKDWAALASLLRPICQQPSTPAGLRRPAGRTPALPTAGGAQDFPGRQEAKGGGGRRRVQAKRRGSSSAGPGQEPPLPLPGAPTPPQVLRSHLSPAGPALPRGDPRAHLGRAAAPPGARARPPPAALRGCRRRDRGSGRPRRAVPAPCRRPGRAAVH